MEDYSVRADRAGINENVERGYSRAEENFGRAVELAASSPWLWGAHTSLEDYQHTNPLEHQLTGELPLQQRNYRTTEYSDCTDAVTKELSPTFRQAVYERGNAYLERSLDPELSREDRLITLDFAKQYLLTTFHAVQYPLRSQAVDAEKMKVIDRTGEAARRATRAFYLDILGHDEAWVRQEIEMAKATYEAPDIRRAVEAADPAYFKAQEMDQPLTILASSLLAVHDYGNTDVIYGLPAGGTQHAIVTQLLFELQRGRQAPPLEYLPISTHSAGKTPLAGKLSPSIDAIMDRCNPRGKNVLICEDNANTGTTLALAADVINASGPMSSHVSITEFDPRRLEVKYKHPEPQAQIANYAHPDFTTAVGIVPITLGTYPDIQLRKIAMLQRKVAAIHNNTEDLTAEATDYAAIPKEFFADFSQEYRAVLRYCGDTYGYRNPHLVSAALVRRYAEKGLIDPGDIEHASRTVLELARAATLYPHIPQHVGKLLQRGEEVRDYHPDGPWIREGAQAFIGELLRYSGEVRSGVTIWTKGDGGTTSNPPHIGLNEQATRFELSGLQASLDSVGFTDSQRGDFVAHPKKTHLLKTRVLPDLLRDNPAIEDIVIIDDSEKNLAEAAQYIRLYGLHPHVINPLDATTQRTNLDEIKTLAEQRAWGDKAAFIVDMDDTLLHEGFRKYHQPRNMALAFLALHPELRES